MTERELKDARDILCKLARSREDSFAYIEGVLDMSSEAIKMLICEEKVTPKTTKALGSPQLSRNEKTPI